MAAALPQRPRRRVPAAARGVSSSGTRQRAGTAQAILETTSTQLIVTVDLDATKQSEAVVGEPVTVELPDGSTVDGKVTEVSPVAQTSQQQLVLEHRGRSVAVAASNQPSATIPVTITLKRRSRRRASTRPR